MCRLKGGTYVIKSYGWLQELVPNNHVVFINLFRPFIPIGKTHNTDVINGLLLQQSSIGSLSCSTIIIITSTQLDYMLKLSIFHSNSSFGWLSGKS